MSFFRPGGRNKTHLVRPMVELQAPTGFETSRKLMRWGAKNSLLNDFHVKRPHRHAKWKYHEPQWVQRKRWIREYWTKRWKKEVRNTVDMALWWKFRVNAKESHDKEQYENYLKQREDKRLKELMKEKKYESWNLNHCIQDIDYINYIRTVQEEEYLLSMQPQTFLNDLRETFLKKKEDRIEGYERWKNDINSDVMNRAQCNESQSNQNIKLNGFDDVTGYDWIAYDPTQTLMLLDNDPDYDNKYKLIQQNKSDKQLLNHIMNQQNKAKTVK